MNSIVELYRRQSEPPQQYQKFIAEAKEYVSLKGLTWDIAYHELGDVLPGQDWDLRVLTGSHDKHAANLGEFTVDVGMQEKAIAFGWNRASLPVASVLSEDVRDFVKALVVNQCRKSRVPRSTRNFARIYKAFFSVVNKVPWELNTEDFDRYLELGHNDKKVQDGLIGIAKVINQHLLAYACPITPSKRTPQVWAELHQSLTSRNASQKLPNELALQELVRIAFHETPETHRDLIRFAATKLLVFTGLRLNEVLMLPADCLRWEEHIDVVTGRPASEVGGVSRSLQLHYFPLKQADKLPDQLVEDLKPVPELFQAVVAESVEQVLNATKQLRGILMSQHATGIAPRGSDLRNFKVIGQKAITTADLLFLQYGAANEQVGETESDTVVTVLGQNSMYLAMGCNKQKWQYSFFVRYGKLSAEEMLFVRPHSLRHLMNTELFRLNVPDTVITQHFGRTSVVQSYEYDHRTLLERLDFVKLPPSANGKVQEGSPQELVAKLVVGGLIPKSHVAQSFQMIQTTSGDEAAIRYLVANTDGFHITPYGLCLNSFSMNPCAKHLKCFDRCKHFAASGLQEHRITLEALRDQLVEARKAAVSKPASTVGWKNQIEHADSLIAGVEATLCAQPHTPVFGGALDHSDITKGDVLS